MLKKLKYILKNYELNRRRKYFGRFAKGIIYNSANGLIAIPYEDMMIGKRLRINGSWNSPEIELLKKVVYPEDNIYILGTHVGTLLIPLSKCCKNIVGYEANPNTFWFLQKNILLNDIQNTKVFNLAVGDKKKNIIFYKNKINTGGSKIKPLHDNKRYKVDSHEEVEVEMISLDDHIISNELPNPNGVVMDIEGAEYLALQGMQDVLKKIRFLYMEYVPHHLRNVAAVSNADLIKLVEPYFDHVISTKTKTEIDIRTSTLKLLKFLDKLDSSENSDDLLFIKNSN